VYWHKSNGKWRAGLKHHGKNAHIGYFTDPLEAAHAYDAYVRRYSLDKGINFPTPPPPHGNDGARDGNSRDQDQDQDHKEGVEEESELGTAV